LAAVNSGARFTSSIVLVVSFMAMAIAMSLSIEAAAK